jgi:putative membrane protein
MVMNTLPSWAKQALGADGYDRIEVAIAKAENTTSGEIVPLLVRRSSTVGHVPILAFAFVMLTAFIFDVPGLLADVTGNEWIGAGLCWLLAAALGFVASRFDIVDRLLTPQPDQVHQVDMRAELEFFELDLSQTDGRTGVLLMISLMEHRAVILADKGISEKLDAEVWQEVVALMIDGVKRGDLTGGMCAAIERCGSLLATEFPLAEGDVNELHDHLIVKN